MISKDNSSGSSTQEATFDLDALPDSFSTEQFETDPDLGTDSGTASTDFGTTTGYAVADAELEAEDDDLKPGSPASTGQFTLEPQLRQRKMLIGQILFGLVLGSILFFLFTNGRDQELNSGVEATDITSATVATAESEGDVDDAEADNFGVGELDADQPTLPRSDLPGVTTTTLGPQQQAPSTILVEVDVEVDDDLDEPELTPEVSSEVSSEDLVEDDLVEGDSVPVVPSSTTLELADDDVDELPSTTTTLEEEQELPEPSVTTIERFEPTTVTTATTTSVPESTTTTAVSTTTVAPTAEMSIASVVDGGNSGLLLSALPELDDHDYCWTITYEASNRITQFCDGQADTVSDSETLLGTATAELEVFDVDGDLVGSDTVTLELLTQSVLRAPDMGDTEPLDEDLRVVSGSRSEITFYCWNVVQGDVSLLTCGPAPTDQVDLSDEDFDAGPALVRGQVFIGPEDNRRLVGSEEVQIEFE